MFRIVRLHRHRNIAVHTEVTGASEETPDRNLGILHHRSRVRGRGGLSMGDHGRPVTCTDLRTAPARAQPCGGRGDPARGADRPQGPSGLSAAAGGSAEAGLAAMLARAGGVNLVL